MKTMLCRIFQLGMKLGYYLIPGRTPERITGEGCVQTLAQPLLDQVK